MPFIKFDIINRYTGDVRFTAEIDCAEDAPKSIKLGLAVRCAIKAQANLMYANLKGADLTDTNLTGIDLMGSDLTGASFADINLLANANLAGANLAGAILANARLGGVNLAGANLIEANLAGADLRRANLANASLEYADLTGANLAGANLADANLADADLEDANLEGANFADAVLLRASLVHAGLKKINLARADLAGANLSGATITDDSLRPFKADLWMTLTESQAKIREILQIIHKLRAGEVDSAIYECERLIGNVAQAHRLTGDNFNQPTERWFSMIDPDDKPGDATGGGFAAAKVLEWIEEWCRLRGIDPAATG